MRRVFRMRSEAYFESRRTLMLPPCSRPSRPSPGGRAKCAALTATALVGGYDVRAGMEGWAPQGPNKRSYGTTDGRNLGLGFEARASNQESPHGDLEQDLCSSRYRASHAVRCAGAEPGDVAGGPAFPDR